MSLQSLLELVVTALDHARVPYMLTGSLAGSYHGAPRATQDVDLVVHAPFEALLTLADELKSNGLYVSEEAIAEAVATRGMFNAVDPESGWKVDFIVRKDRPFSVSEFESRVAIDFGGLRLFIVRAEDVVVAKLEWAKLAQADRQLHDVADVLRVQRSTLDLTEVEKWVVELGLEGEWERARELAGPESA